MRDYWFGRRAEAVSTLQKLRSDYERAFAECLDRLADVPRRFASALLIGVPDPGWIDRLKAYADKA